MSLERVNFQKVQDKNGDGFLDMEEVRSWIMPRSYDHSEAWRGEALHLVTEADDNQDNFLTRKEILDNYGRVPGHGLREVPHSSR